MNNEKYRAIRKALINAPLDTITDFQAKHDIEDYSIHKLAEWFAQNGDSGLDYDMTSTLMECFIEFADNHTLITRNRIIKDVMYCNYDFLMDDWDVIWNAIFDKTKYYDSVVYVVTEEMEGPKWDNVKEFELLSNWDKAVESFLDSKENADISMRGRCDEEDINAEYDNETHYLVEAGGYNYWYEVTITKRELK